jgi:hypothetical protein
VKNIKWRANRRLREEREEDSARSEKKIQGGTRRRLSEKGE